ncbi:hypothetical protein [Mucilaginibacter kameinonensis]|uniref:hypothetical protein n=1 Tax=Mucilaginibacter kameinonensis TaxID=452286 RepID=UPI000EF806CA|nr:hypothetical protein [Mucilaginibacter kameinonensis]
MNIIPFKGRNTSLHNKLNFLYNTGKTYIMDNHMAAGWCWLQKVDLYNQYHLFYIDRHYNLMVSQIDEWVAYLHTIEFDYQAVSIEELQAILFTRPDNPDGGAFPLFRWDNYITILDRLYPALWSDRSFVTHRDGDIPDGYELHEPDFEDLPKNLGYWLENKRHKSVLNLDIDHFFIKYNQKYIQLFTDDFIKVVAKEIASAWDNIEVFTIALSPECCGGWDNAVRVAKVITDELQIDWEMK